VTRGVARLGAAALLCLVAAAAGSSSAAAAALTIHLSAAPTKTILRLQPGFATVVRSDRRIDTVAIGDPRLVTATTVKRGADVYDIVLQPQTPSGATNMIVWLGETTSVWELIIGPGLRTADIVYLVTAPSSPNRDAPVIQTSAAAPPAPGALSPARPDQGPVAGRTGAVPPPAPPPAAAPGRLEAQQALKGAAGTFELWRTPGGVKVRYQITNQSAGPLWIRPNSVLVRANGRLVPFAMSIDGDKGRLSAIAPGATRSGAITAAIPAPREVMLVLSVFPAAPDRGGGAAVPATFQLLFVDLQQLAPARS
jgi:hypothetical protein